MPWILKVEASQQKEDFVLVCNVATTTTGERVYKIGRKDADINIPGEKIVSREHARIYVCPLSKESVYDIDSRPQVYIEDSSKFGTFIGGKNIGKNKQTLHDGDEITLGNNDSNRMVISFHQIIICPSKLKPKQELEASCRSIGAHIVSDWRNDCTHLCMTKAEVTPKLVLALASVKPVVRPDYFRSVAEGGLSELPDTRLYHPPVPETELGMDLSPLSERRTLFKGMKFILLSSDPLKRLAEILSSAGGTIHEAFDPKAPIPMPTDDEEASSSSSKCSLVVVLPAESDSASEAMDSVVNRYEKVRMLGIHGVQETNIYQAVLTANLEALNLVAPTAMPSQRTRKPSAPAQAAVRHKEPESDDEHVEEIGYRSKFQKRTRHDDEDMGHSDIPVIQADLIKGKLDGRVFNVKRFRKTGASPNGSTNRRLPQIVLFRDEPYTGNSASKEVSASWLEEIEQARKQTKQKDIEDKILDVAPPKPSRARKH